MRLSIALFAFALLPSCQSDRPPGGIAEPVPEWSSMFSSIAHDEDTYFAGRPSELGLRTAVDEGVVTVVSLMTVEEEKQSLGFDEEQVVTALGARFVRIPVRIESFAAADVDRFAQELAATDGKLLVHCSSGNRTGGMWAAYLIRTKSIAQDEALGAGINAGMKSNAMVEAVRRVASTPSLTP